jgi:hypothetical protein
LAEVTLTRRARSLGLDSASDSPLEPIHQSGGELSR